MLKLSNGLIETIGEGDMISFTVELSYQDSKLVVGVDEAGRGPLMGPVVAAAACFRDYRQEVPLGLNDSKQLSAKQRERIFQALLLMAEQGKFGYGVAQATAQEIDQFNIRQATKLAMRRAVETFKSAYPDLAARVQAVIVDGNFVPELDWQLAHVDAIVAGDTQSYSIAAASIMAKVTRDHWVDQLAVKFPQYDWQHNKGYGTAKHLQAIQQYGVHPEHRRSFAPIRQALMQPML